MRLILNLLGCLVVFVGTGCAEPWRSVDRTRLIDFAEIGSVWSSAVSIEIPNITTDPYKLLSNLNGLFDLGRDQEVLVFNFKTDFLAGRQHSAVNTRYLFFEYGRVWREFDGIPNLQFISEVHELAGSFSKVTKVAKRVIIVGGVGLHIELVNLIYKYPTTLDGHREVGLLVKKARLSAENNALYTNPNSLKCANYKQQPIEGFTKRFVRRLLYFCVLVFGGFFVGLWGGYLFDINRRFAGASLFTSGAVCIISGFALWLATCQGWWPL